MTSSYNHDIFNLKEVKKVKVKSKGGEKGFDESSNWRGKYETINEKEGVHEFIRGVGKRSSRNI